MYCCIINTICFLRAHWPWPLTTQIQSVHPLIRVNICLKFEENQLKIEKSCLRPQLLLAWRYKDKAKSAGLRLRTTNVQEPSNVTCVVLYSNFRAVEQGWATGGPRPHSMWPASQLPNTNNSQLVVSHWHGSGSGTASVLESQNLGAVCPTSPLSHQFKWNQSGRTSFHLTQVEVNTATTKWQVLWIIYEHLFCYCSYLLPSNTPTCTNWWC